MIPPISLYLKPPRNASTMQFLCSGGTLAKACLTSNLSPILSDWKSLAVFVSISGGAEWEKEAVSSYGGACCRALFVAIL